MSKNKFKTVRLTDRDLMMLKILYRVPWAMDWHIALLIGEPVKYVRGRMNQLADGGLVERKKLISGQDVLNYLLAEGCRAIGYEVKKKREPKIARFEHDRGVLDSYVWLCLKGARFGNIVTEKVMYSAIELEKVGDKWVRLGRDIHLPDGYYLKPDGSYLAIEFERTRKNKTSTHQMISNVHANSRRFGQQFWFVALPSIEADLKKSLEYSQGRLKIFRIVDVRVDLAQAVSELPSNLSDKIGTVPRVLFSDPIEAVPVARLPLVKPSVAQNQPVFDRFQRRK